MFDRMFEYLEKRWERIFFGTLTLLAGLTELYGSSQTWRSEVVDHVGWEPVENSFLYRISLIIFGCFCIAVSIRIWRYGLQKTQQEGAST